LRKLRLTILFFAVFVMISCEHTNTANKDDEFRQQMNYSFEHPETGQSFNIVHAYKLYDTYEKALNSNSKESDSTLFEQEVIEPVYNQCFNGGEYFEMDEDDPVQLPKNIKEIQSVIEKIDVDETNNMIKEALIKSSTLMPSKKVTNVCVFPSTNVSSAYMVTEGVGKITILFNKFYKNEIIKGGVAHEYYHSVWTENHFSNIDSFTVLDNLVMEGKAVMFEKLVFPDYSLTKVNFSNNKEYWAQIEPDLHKVDPNRASEILFGGKGLPKSFGYSEGYKMVDSFLEVNPNVTLEEWTALSAEEIFEKGKYMEKYK
jgi:uncharacterized protein YjaZ